MQKLERAWLNAYEEHDEKAMDAIVADDFAMTFPNGSIQTKAQIMAMVRNPKSSTGPAMKFHTRTCRPAPMATL